MLLLLVLPFAIAAAEDDSLPSPELPTLQQARMTDRDGWAALRRESQRLLHPATLLEFLDQVDSHGVQTIPHVFGTQALDMFQALLTTGLDALERDEPMIRSLDFRFHPELRADTVAETALTADMLLSLAEHGRGTLFSQGGLRLREGEPDLNLGLGYRWSLAEHWLLGGNVFYDHLAATSMDRYSLGLEMKSRWLDLYGNFYRGQHTSVDWQREASLTPQGWDLELAGRVPQLPWVEVLGKYYFWNNVGAEEDLSGLEYGLRVMPIPFAGVEFRYDRPQTGEAAFSLEANLEYRFGVPMASQFRLRSHVDGASLQRRFERVRRQYEAHPQDLQQAQKNGTNEDAAGAVHGRVYLDDTMLAGLTLGSPIARPAAGERRSVTVHLQGLTASDTDQLRLELVGRAVLGVDYRVASLAAAPGQVNAVFSGTTAHVALPAPGQAVAIRFDVLPGNGTRRPLRLKVQDRELTLFDIHPAPRP